MTEPGERRLPVYLVVDCSESMLGEGIEGAQRGLATVASALQSDPMALETVWVSVITFADRAVQTTPLTEMYRFAPPQLRVRPGTALGAALDLVAERIRAEVRVSTPTQRGDWRPMVFVITDGAPTDVWQPAARRLRQANATVVAVGCGPYVDSTVLSAMTDQVFLSSDDEASIREVFKWVSASIVVSSVKVMAPDAGVPLADAQAAGLARLTAGEDVATLPPEVFLAVRCATTRRPFLVRYRTDETATVYQPIRSHAVDEDYFAAGPGDAVTQTETASFNGIAACPYCGNALGVRCDCGTLFCRAEGATTVTCPSCGTEGIAGGAARGTVSGRHG